MTITIESAVKLDDTQKKELEAVLSKKATGSFTYVVNPKILGGLRVKLGGKQIDLSLAGKLSQIKEQLS